MTYYNAIDSSLRDFYRLKWSDIFNKVSTKKTYMNKTTMTVWLLSFSTSKRKLDGGNVVQVKS